MLILDEPTANLDPNVRREVMKILRQLRDEGRTILLSSHVLSEIEEACDRVVILRDGRLVHTQNMQRTSPPLPCLGASGRATPPARAGGLVGSRYSSNNMSTA